MSIADSFYSKNTENFKWTKIIYDEGKQVIISHE